jgi:hypothetical protein
MVLNNAQRHALGWILAIAFTLLLCGCGRAYRLQHEGSMAILVPPVKPATIAGNAEPGFRIKLRNARSAASSRSDCDIENPFVNIHWRGKAADIQLTPEPYFEPPGSQHPHEIGPRVYLDSQERLERFQHALAEREAKGCLDDGERIRQSMAERFAFPPGLSFFIRFGDYATAGFIDLTSVFHLKVVNPDDLNGYKTTYYTITRGPTNERVRIAPAEKTASPPFTLPDAFKLYRLMFRMAQTSGGRLATLLSADDASNLEVATRQLLASPDGSCAFVFAPGVVCFAPPPHVAVNPEFAIRVNAEQRYVPPGVTLVGVVRFNRGSAPPGLRVRRLFRGRLVPLRFDPATGDIRQLMLMPGDEISAS